MMRMSHISLTARDALALAAFYSEVFGFEEKRAPVRLRGSVVARGNGVPGAEIDMIWLHLPQDAGVLS